MSINFDDPGETTHEGETIPINTEAKYEAAEKVMMALYRYAGVAYTAESAAAFENRVRQGQGLKEIIGNTVDEYLDRMDVPHKEPK